MRKKKQVSIKSDITADVKTKPTGRQFRERLTRVTSPVTPGKRTAAMQWNRWTP